MAFRSERMMPFRLLAATLLLALATPAWADRAESLEFSRKAELALAKRQPRVARIELLNAIKADPTNGAAHLLQGKVYLELGDGVAAEAAIGRARETGIDVADTRHLMAHALLLQRADQRALEEADFARVPRRYAGYAARIRGRALVALGRFSEATVAFAEAARRDPRSPAMWTDLGRFRLVTGNIAGGMEAANRALALDRRNPDALLLRGELARVRSGPAAGMAWFARGLAVDPQHVPTLLAKAATFGDLRRMREMLAATRAVLLIDPGNPLAFQLQAMLAARARNFALARGLMQRAGDALDGQPAAMLLRGVIEYRLGNHGQAIESLSRLIAADPDNLKARRILGAARWGAGDAPGTIAALQPVADLRQADADSLRLIARAHARRGDRVRAADYLDRAAMPPPLIGVAPVDPEAIGALRRRVTANPATAAPRIALIRALLRSGRIDEALTEALTLQSARPRAPLAHVLAGDALAASGRFADAANAYRKAADLRFTEPAVIRLVEALRSAGQAEAASSTLATFLERHPGNVSAQLLEADFLMNAGRFDQAVPRLESLRARLGDRDAAVLNNLAWSYFHTGRSREGIAAAARAYALAPTKAVVSHTYGWLLFSSGANRERGLRLLEQAARQAPRDPLVRQRLAQAHAAGGASSQP
jgi:tetratricopeptide (TPR) repeat protein